MDAKTGGSSHGFSIERLELGLNTLSKNTDDITLEDIKKLKSTRPILVNPGKEARTFMSMITEIPKKGNPVLYQTPDSPNWFDHVKFEF